MLAEQSLEVKLAAGLESESRVALGVLLERRGNEDLAAASLVCGALRRRPLAPPRRPPPGLRCVPRAPRCGPAVGLDWRSQSLSASPCEGPLRCRRPMRTFLAARC